MLRGVNKGAMTYIFLLFVDMADLEPDVFLSQRRWWRCDNVIEAL
jgi:hypothetical protein